MCSSIAPESALRSFPGAVIRAGWGGGDGQPPAVGERGVESPAVGERKDGEPVGVSGR